MYQWKHPDIKGWQSLPYRIGVYIENLRKEKTKMYSREEVVNICHDLYYEAQQPQDGFFDKYKSFEHWCEVNLKE